MARIVSNAKLYVYMLIMSFKQRLAYRSSLWIEIVHGGLFLLLQGSLWTSLIAAGHEGTDLEDVLTYVVINDLVGRIVSFKTNNIISSRVEDGSIASDILMPVGFKWKIFFENVGGNLFDFVFSGGSTLVIALVFFRLQMPSSLISCGIFAFSTCLGVLISYHINFLFGLSAFWLMKPWYLTALLGALTKLFGGMVIPIWMYPDWLQIVCEWLPFKYVSYIPIQIYLGQLSGGEMYGYLVVQIILLCAMALLSSSIWSKARKKVFVNGG